jgi:hypothetical protein
MQKLLVINGCSHTAGSEIPGAGIGDGVECRQKSFGNLLAGMLGRTPINMAVPGGSNERICRTTMAWVGQHIEQIINKEIDVIFLIHWTSAERFDFRFNDKSFGEPDLLKVKFADYCEDPCYASITSQNPIPNNNKAEIYKIYQTLFLNGFETWSDNKIKNIVSLQGCLKQFNLPYWFGDGFYSDYCVTQTYKTLKCLIDNKYFPYHDQRDKSYYWMCKDAGFKNQDESNKKWHLDGEAHKFYAKWLLEEFKKVNFYG